MEDVPPQEMLHMYRKMGYFCSAVTEVQMRENRVFLTPIKHTLVCCMPGHIGFPWPHDTLSCVLIYCVLVLQVLCVP